MQAKHNIYNRLHEYNPTNKRINIPNLKNYIDNNFKTTNEFISAP